MMLEELLVDLISCAVLGGAIGAVLVFGYHWVMGDRW